ncbi:MAPEG family protein [Parablastomonas sp. CN1-191]|uniref:MAPEG family protein n=1 Tax=Parablastomonas sp. CN1-191 TaxID=3400908 RepID=UPI003BF87728
MIGMDILRPVLVLAAWTLVVWAWMVATRIPALKSAGIDIGTLTGGTGRDAGKIVPPQVQWKADNFNHLHEAPTVFYAAALVLAMIGQGDGINAALGWAFVTLRIAHSLVQTLWNKVSVRFLLYVLSQLALAALILHGLIAVFAA